MSAKRFGGLEALAAISLTIGRGEIYGLIGPNGAGKTTFFNVLTGVYRADGGGFRFDGAPLDVRAPHEVAAAGIARTFQNIRLFANMTALENVMVGRHVRTRAGVVGAILRTAAHPRRRKCDPRARMGAARLRRHSPAAATSWRTACPTATSAGSRSRARSPPSRSCSRSTSRPPA